MSDQSMNENETQEAWSMDDVIKYVQELMVYEEEIKVLQEAKREWSKEYLEDHPIPKKELAIAIAMAKKNLDADVVSDMHDEIYSLITGEEA